MAQRAEPKWRGWRHLLPALVVFIVVAAFMLLGVTVFTLVFLVDGWFQSGAVLAGVASGLGVAAGVSLATLALGLILDRLTSTAPAVIRLAAPAPLAVVGVILVSTASDGVWFYVGFYLLGFTVAMSVHWVVFLLLGAVGWSARRARARLGRQRSRPAATRPMAQGWGDHRDVAS